MERFCKPAEVKELLAQKEVWIAQTLFEKPDSESTVFYTPIELCKKDKDGKSGKVYIKDAFSHCYRSGPERIRCRDTWLHFYQEEIKRLKAKGTSAELQYNTQKEVRVIRRLRKEEIIEVLAILDKLPDVMPNEKNYVLAYLPVRIKMVEEDSNRIEREKRKGKKGNESN